MRPIDVVRKVAPNARREYLAAIENGDALFRAAGITTPVRLAHFLAQVLHETGGFRITRENMNYSAERLMEVFGVGRHSAKVTAAEARELAHNPEAIAERVYGLGNPGKARELGNTMPGDGYRYRGNGAMQTTGRGNHRRMGQKSGLDLEGHPELALTAEHALKPALAEWTEGNLNAAADRDEIRTITRRINGGYNGLADRENWYRRIRPLIASVELVPGTIVFPPFPSPVEPAPEPAADIRALQKRLNELKVGMPIAVDGIMGPQTLAALRAFQRSKGLDPDGIVGPRTRAALDAVPAPAPKPVVPPAAKQGGLWSAIAAAIAGAFYWLGDHPWAVALIITLAAGGAALYWYRKRKD